MKNSRKKEGISKCNCRNGNFLNGCILSDYGDNFR